MQGSLLRIIIYVGEVPVVAVIVCKHHLVSEEQIWDALLDSIVAVSAV